MNKQEFLDRLKENKFIENCEELIDYRLPVVQFFLSNYTNSMLSNGVNTLSSRLINIIPREEDFTLINQAYMSILELYKQGSLK